MKKYIFYFLSLVVVLPLSADVLEINSIAEPTNRVFVGSALKMTRVKYESGLMFGVSAGWEIDKNLALGFANYRLVSDIEMARVNDKPQNLNFSYRGVTARYIVRKGLGSGYLSINGLIGQGKLRYIVGDESKFLVFEPGVEFEFIPVLNLQVGVGVSYRYVRGIELGKLHDNQFREITALIRFRLVDFSYWFVDGSTK
ncbi:hypothetical protein CMK22_09875 [Candidatus Poribacteria bacterium]|nr:hypothetical protein [Candidatus Poribacteria bacterium]